MDVNRIVSKPCVLQNIKSQLVCDMIYKMTGLPMTVGTAKVKEGGWGPAPKAGMISLHLALKRKGGLKY